MPTSPFLPAVSLSVLDYVRLRRPALGFLLPAVLLCGIGALAHGAAAATAFILAFCAAGLAYGVELRRLWAAAHPGAD